MLISHCLLKTNNRKIFPDHPFVIILINNLACLMKINFFFRCVLNQTVSYSVLTQMNIIMLTSNSKRLVIIIMLDESTSTQTLTGMAVN